MIAAVEMEALAIRCECEEPTSGLNIAIAKALGWTSVILGYVVWRNPAGRDSRLPNFVGSLDSAVTLVPDDWFVYEIRQLGPKHFYVSLCLASDDRPRAESEADTEIAARCAAALRARAAVAGAP